MLIEFTTGNFASFKEPVTLSLVASSLVSKNKRLDENNLLKVDDQLSLLASAAIYGPNASGKSNLVTAANFMREFVRSSFKETRFDEPIPVEPFRLSTETENQPSFFEMVFLLAGHQYRYGFEVTPQAVVSEWLYYVPKKKEVLLFSREGQQVAPHSRDSRAREFRAILSQLERINPEEPLRPNALFLSVAAQNNGPVAQGLLTWFGDMHFMPGLSDVGFRQFTIKMFEDPAMRERIMDLVCSLDVGIQQIDIQMQARDEALQEMPTEIRDIMERVMKGDRVLISTRHQKFDAAGKPVEHETFDMARHESGGTQKLFFMTGPIIDTLSKGRILWVDEMEARLHSNITQAIVKLFNSRETNPKGAQLIFTTHDTNLLDLNKLRRDQVWFIDKDHLAASRLYSLSDFKVRNDDASIAQDYMIGRFGAVPHLGEMRAVYKADAP